MKTKQTRRNSISRLRVKALAPYATTYRNLSEVVKRCLQSGANRY